MESVWIVMSYLFTGACGCAIGISTFIAACALIASGAAGKRDGKTN